MKKANIVIFESSEEFLEELKNYLDGREDFNVCAVTGNGNAGIEYIEQYKPDVAILNLVLSGKDGFAVLDYIRDNHPEVRTIVVSNFSDERIINSAIAHGAKYYFVKPVDPRNIAERIEDILAENALEYRSAEIRAKRKVTSVDEKISNIFISIGIPPHIKGYAYLREGIKMAIENPAVINNVTKELYPNIGKKFDTTASKVERAIRHAIEVAWNRGRVDAINAIFGVRVYIGSERPTNSEFIALVADKLILEELL
ncbi:MAG TPA: sporulation transcription factor Spo0A [Candidatus Coproplasma excrementigallinarum]|uniref:Stage 0 sporulation protein A homolog n=1 Tax=Candidatus Coproplasma excrementigallinarum TaxID=2840747 RepID=A0A9D1SJB1_9FIRM|nr:sporulation transcription factor Spo0A [Candidatus Coproplasma excrementigallinarum]